MPRLTEAQAKERVALVTAVSTVTKVEPRMFAAHIHNCLIGCREHGLSVEDSIKDLELALRTMHTHTTYRDKWGMWLSLIHI